MSLSLTKTKPESVGGRLACPRFLSLLARFYEGLPEPPPLDAMLVEPAEMPEPYRGLLVHENDMTPTLEAFHRERLKLRVIQRRLVGETFSRHIVLVGAKSGRPVEYGAIRIQLGALDEAARREVIECRTPLGRILESHGISHKCCPGAFFRIETNDLMSQALRAPVGRRLYGRCNCLSDGEGRTIAEVVEILPIENHSLPIEEG
jgi:chorismate-pyruvate lyase